MSDRRELTEEELVIMQVRAMLDERFIWPLTFPSKTMKAIVRAIDDRDKTIADLNNAFDKVEEHLTRNGREIMRLTEQNAIMREVCELVLDAHKRRGAVLTAACGDNEVVIKALEALAKVGEAK